jgi:hypothetical protein
VVYVPPRRGAPRAKVGGGLRGAPALPTTLALAPVHTAETVSARPSLFWHIDSPPASDARLVFTLVDDLHVDPIAEFELPRPRRAGIQRVDLAARGVTLEPDVEYEWSIALVSDLRSRSDDRISAGYIRRVAAPAELERELATARAYAAHGLWYDALASIADAIEASPGSAALRAQRDSLLRQAHLDAAVEAVGPEATAR